MAYSKSKLKRTPKKGRSISSSGGVSKFQAIVKAVQSVENTIATPPKCREVQWRLLHDALQQQLIPYIHGPPGTGKTMTAKTLVVSDQDSVLLINFGDVTDHIAALSVLTEPLKLNRRQKLSIPEVFRLLDEKYKLIILDECDRLAEIRTPGEKNLLLIEELVEVVNELSIKLILIGNDLLMSENLAPSVGEKIAEVGFVRYTLEEIEILAEAELEESGVLTEDHQDCRNLFKIAIKRQYNSGGGDYRATKMMLLHLADVYSKDGVDGLKAAMAKRFERKKAGMLGEYETLPVEVKVIFVAIATVGNKDFQSVGLLYDHYQLLCGRLRYAGVDIVKFKSLLDTLVMKGLATVKTAKMRTRTTPGRIKSPAEGARVKLTISPLEFDYIRTNGDDLLNRLCEMTDIHTEDE